MNDKKNIYLKSISSRLENTELFKGFDSKQINNLLAKLDYTIKEFNKGEIIAIEGDEIKELGLVLFGEIDVKKLHENGKMLQVKKLISGDSLGHANIFSDINYYSSTLIASNNSKVMFIPNEAIVDLCMSNRQFFHNFVRILSNQIVFLSNRMKFISSGKIRKKIINYLFTEYKKQNNSKIKVSVTRKKMAEIFGVSRPALSNEMILMKKEGLIEYKDNIIEILDFHKLEKELEK